MNIRLIVFGLWCLLFQSCLYPVYAVMPVPPATSPLAWKITKTQWSNQDEKSFQEFVQRIGEAVESRQCVTVSQCMKSPANPYYKSDPQGLVYQADCADFPYYLRAYFAWKNGLPFSFSTSMKPRNVANNNGDIRYTRYGNEVAARYTTASESTQNLKSAVTILNELVRNSISSANLRFHYADDKAQLYPDFYPVQISRDAIQPGTTLYDPNGHVAVIYKVSDDGKVFFIDAHPDNSITAGTFGKKFIRSHPGQGAGFKNWRPQTLIGATLTPEGYYIGGTIQAARNQELPLYSTEQFFGNTNPAANETNTEWAKGPFVINGATLTYYEFVRQKLSAGALAIYPVKEFQDILQDLCDSLKDRVVAVDLAIKAGISKKPHPERLPENIYGTHGEWETYSTPSRDAQLKVSFNDLLFQAQDFITKWKNQDPTVVYSGTNLAQELLDVYERESRTCEISYENSAGQAVTLSLEDIRQRLFKLSFDPYHCVELRWGAQNANELSTCSDNANKQLWYQREQRLRNQEVRQYEARMDFTLDDLLKPLPGNGKDTPPDVDILGFLKSQLLSIAF